MDRKKTFVVFLLIIIQSFTNFIWAQIMETDDVVMPKTTESASGAITPYFWVGAQAVGSVGYNIETGAFGIKSEDDDTWASFNIAMVSSKYDTPKHMEVGGDTDLWSGHLKLINYTMLLNSWESEAETNTPAFIAEIAGKGFHFGLFSQAGEYIKDPLTSLTAGGEVLFFDDPVASEADVYDTVNPYTTTEYDGSAIIYVGYKQDGLFKSYLSLLSEGDIDTEVGSADGVAGALDFSITPLGDKTDYAVPFTVAINGNLLTGTGFEENPTGFGISVEPSIFLNDDLILTPEVSFDGTIPEGEDLQWGVGGGLILQMSGKRWIDDSWGELDDPSDYFDGMYENTKILKYAYTQLYTVYSEEDDLDIALKFEEPDGIAGFNENLGAMAEFRLNNLLEETSGSEMAWSLSSRLSFDFSDHKTTPYVRAYLNSEDVFRVRAGVQLSGFIPHTGFEFAYTSKNLNESATSTASGDEFDLGRVEFLFIIKTDSGMINTPKSMDVWDY